MAHYRSSKYILSCTVSALVTCMAFSQKETWNWYMSGSPAPALNFPGGGAPVSLTNNAMALSWEGCGTISDANGNLLFYVDGTSRIYCSNHATPANGSNVFMGNSVTQGPIFVPKPGSPNIYYMFHIGLPSVGPPPPFNLYYSELNLTLNGGLGDITTNKNVSIASSFGACSEKMSVTKHCNGTDYWLLVHSYTGNTFRAYPITAAGVGAAVVSNVGTAHVSNGSGDDAIGQMKISPNGTKVALVVNLSGFAEAFDFNKLTGVVSNPIALGVAGPNPYGLEFSPDNSKIYTSNSATPGVIKQWDLCAGTPAQISASMVNITNANVYGMQLAADGKIYGSRFTTSMCVINNPNVAGTGCNFVANGVSVAPQSNSLGIPGFITSYFDSPSTAPQATVIPANSGCGCTGSATASICTVFGASPYTYVWSNGTTTGPTTALTASVSNLCAGTHTLIVSDATCRVDTAVFTITGGGNSFTVTPISTAASCGSANGTASVTVTGGTSPYTYVWNPSSQTGASATGLTAGNYSVTITDANNCTQTSVVNISSAGGGSVTITPQNITCNGSNNGTANATPAGGSSPFTYAWSNGASTSLTTGLAAGTYTVIVTDGTGCSSTETVTITQPTAITASVSTTQTTCGQSTGTASAAAAGGTGSYTYLWSSSETTSAISGLAAGVYSCTVTDANGCSQTVLGTVSNSNGPTVNISGQTQPSCFGGNNGTASASVLGGNPPYTFVWSNGQSSQNANNLSSGTYTVTVTDGSGCSNSQVVTINQPAGINASATGSTASCNVSDGTAAASASGGTGIFTYSWNNGQTSQTATGLGAGSYTVTVTDANGCTQIATASVANGTGPTASAGNDVTIQQGSSANLNASGGTGYSWSPATGLNNPAIANPVASPSATTQYCVVVTDAGGCSDSACITVYIDLPCGEFYLPNAFSPNGDGENDDYHAYIRPDCVVEFKLTIHNRWGEKVFETEDPAGAWNGEYRGVMSNPAVYGYYCKALFTNGQKIFKKGNVSLMR